MKASEILGKIFSAPKNDYMEKYHGRTLSYISGNLIFGGYLVAEATAVEMGHTPDYRDVIIGIISYAGDRAKNKIVDIIIPRFEAGFDRFSSYVENKLKE